MWSNDVVEVVNSTREMIQYRQHGRDGKFNQRGESIQTQRRSNQSDDSVQARIKLVLVR